MLIIKHFALPLKRLDFVPPVIITNKCNQGLKCSQETKVKRRKIQKAKIKGLRLSLIKYINIAADSSEYQKQKLRNLSANSETVHLTAAR